MGFPALLLVAAVGMLLLARLFLKGPSTSIAQDDRPTTLANRGDFCPYIIGKFKTGYVFTWAGDQQAFTRQEDVGGSGGKKGFGGGGSASQTVWFMPAKHLLGHQMTSLTEIEEGGKIVWQGNLTRENTPSGSTVDAGDAGIFRIYWGEWNQPIDPDLAAFTGIRSRWPGRAYIYWVEKRLGTSRQWPQINYTREHAFVRSTLSVPYMIDNGTYRGVNAMQALLQLLCGTDPYGVAIPSYDQLSAEKVAQQCEDEGLAVNFVVDDTAEKAIQGLLLDMGANIVDHKGSLYFSLNRFNDDPIPVLDEGTVLAPEQEVNLVTDEKAPNRIVFTFKDKNNRYRDNDLKFDEAGIRESQRRWNTRTIALSSVTDLSVAQTIANRRVAEAFGDDATFKIEATRGTGLFLPGSTFQTGGMPLRVLAVERDTISAKVTLDCQLDAYSVNPDDLILDSNNSPPPPTSGAAVEDFAFTFLQVPDDLATPGPTKKIIVLRIRGHLGTSGSTIWASADAAAYSALGVQNSAAAGGILEEAIAASATSPIEAGPIFEAVNRDIERVQDLTDDTASWEAGVQLLVINDEVFFLRNVTAQTEVEWAPNRTYSIGDSVIPTADMTGLRYVCKEAGTSAAAEPSWARGRLGIVLDGTCVWEARGFRYRLNGLVRARYGSDSSFHSPGDVAYIIRAESLTHLTGPIVTPDRSLCIKSQPFGSSSNVPLSSIAPICKTIV